MTEEQFNRTELNRQPTHPGEILREDILPALDLTVSEAARQLRVTRQTLHHVLSGTSAISPEMALRLGKFCGNGPKLWLRMQQAYDLWAAEKKLGEELEQISGIQRRFSQAFIDLAGSWENDRSAEEIVRHLEDSGSDAAGRQENGSSPTGATALTASTTDFELTADHYRWAGSARRKHGQSKQYWLELIVSQGGLCAFSRAPLFFDAAAGTAVAGGHSQHPLYAVVDHSLPGSDHYGHQIVSNDLNDLKGHLPPQLFAALQRSEAWKDLMARWRNEALRNPHERSIFHELRRRPT